MDKCKICGTQLGGLKCHKCGTYRDKTKTEPSKDKSILEKASSFASATVKHARDGFKNVSDETKQNRTNICKKCKHYDESSDTCRQCGCYLSVKTSWASESCPVGKWGADIRSSAPKTCSKCGKKKT